MQLQSTYQCAKLASLSFAFFFAFSTAQLQASVFAQFDAARHDRFLADGSVNPTGLLASFDTSGVGFNSRAVLISSKHYITAHHLPTGTPSFRGSDGVVRSYATSGFTQLTTIDPVAPGLSDIRLYTLADPIPVLHGVAPVAIAAGSSSSFVGEEFFLVGQGNTVGKNVIDQTTPVSFAGGVSPSHSIFYSFDTDTNGGSGGLGGDEAGLIGGDSGHPALIDVNGQLALIGTHFGISVPPGNNAANGDFYFNFTTRLTPYLDEINTLVAADGESITTLSLDSVVAVPEPNSLIVLSAFGLVLIRRRKA